MKINKQVEWRIILNDLGSICVDTPAQLIYFRLNGWITGDFYCIFWTRRRIRRFDFRRASSRVHILPPFVTLVYACAICLDWRLIGLKWHRNFSGFTHVKPLFFSMSTSPLIRHHHHPPHNRCSDRHSISQFSSVNKVNRPKPFIMSKMRISDVTSRYGPTKNCIQHRK